MGQYWLPVNLDRHEFIDPHKLGSGLELREQLASHPGTAAALIILLAAQQERRAGGDLDTDRAIARRVIGRWAGDRVAIVGDRAVDSDLSGFYASTIHEECRTGRWEDISEDVARVLEHELGGHFTGSGWRDFVRDCIRQDMPQGTPCAPNANSSWLAAEGSAAWL